MPHGSKEKCTSTLTGKLKGDVTAIYNVLIEGVYKRAGYIAHRLIGYKTQDGDYYDKSQWDVKGVSVHGKKYRKTGVDA